MKLCAYCRDTILGRSGELSWDYHHASYQSLRDSSSFDGKLEEGLTEQQQKKERCIFCWTLKQDVDSLAPSLVTGDKKGEWPVHRWNIRSLARLRESLECIVVIFRWIPRSSKDGVSNGVPKTETIESDVILPTRTFYLFEESALGPLPSLSELGPSTNPSKSGGDLIKSWINTCNSSHSDCQKYRKTAKSNKTSFVPTRLVDISGGPNSNCRVIETKTTVIKGPYASLSHCWGKIKFVELTPDTHKRFTTEGVPWALFSKNFCEAIEVARFLEIDYIWIDSLCIIQGDAKLGGDFLSEAPRMHHVYRNSYCNIALVDSADSTGGAYRTRNAEDVAPVRYEAEGDSAMFGKKVWRIVPQDLWETDLLRTVLYKRGWVFQERMLAPRILHFAKQQVFWDCPSMSACESLPSGLPQPLDSAAGPDRHWRGRLQESEDKDEPLAGAKDDSIESFWKAAVWKYTSCNLTKGSDKLMAMWGIAKLVRDAIEIEYGDGLWEKNLEDQLAWRVAECKMEMRPSYSKEWALERNIPTWSWASMDGAIEVPGRMTDRPHYTVKDHNGQPLAFDLVGVKRGVEPVPLGEQPEPMQQRGKSDSVVELQKRFKEMEDSKAQQVSRDDPPKFYSESLPMQGHVGRGRLVWNEATKKWIIDIEGVVGSGEIDVFPDTKPKVTEAADMEPYFIVLSAKQVFKPVAEAFQSPDPQEVQTEFNFGEYAEPEDNPVMESDIMVNGVGILMKDVGNHHFHRTGALHFRNIALEAFAKLQITYRSAELPSDKYNQDRGRKIWLD